MTGIKTAAIRRKTHRLIASRFPTIGVFDDIAANPQDLRDAFLIESLTNDRMAPAAARMTNLPDAEIITGVQGSGATLLMAAFLHANEAGGRFTDGRLGAWYAGLSTTTAIHETLHHNTARLRKSAGGFPNRIQMRELVAGIACELVDIRGAQATMPGLYDPDDYGRSQAWAAELRWPRGTGQGAPANGIVFDSVRHAGGTNVCLFWPSKVKLPVLQADHYEYHWNAMGEPSVVRLAGVAL